jgi:LemA protein
MKGGVVALVGVVIAAVMFGGCYVSQRNSIVQSDVEVSTAWSQVENAYQRRSDLIPNLVETVKGVSGFEKETYTQVAEARANAGKVQISAEDLEDPEKVAQFEKAQQQLSSGLGRLLATAEAYPQLKANEAFAGLMAELAGSENRIAVERKRFNDSVQAYNLKVRQFPGSLIASTMGAKEKAYFRATEGSDVAPKVKF